MQMSSSVVVAFAPCWAYRVPDQGKQLSQRMRFSQSSSSHRIAWPYLLLAQHALRAVSQAALRFRFQTDKRGEYWLRAAGRVGGAAHPQVIHGVLADIDVVKRAEAERSHLLRRLASAQEEEQRRISRELHDQIGQTVTGLSLGLKALEQELAKEKTARRRLSRYDGSKSSPRRLAAIFIGQLRTFGRLRLTTSEFLKQSKPTLRSGMNITAFVSIFRRLDEIIPAYGCSGCPVSSGSGRIKQRA